MRRRCCSAGSPAVSAWLASASACAAWRASQLAPWSRSRVTNAMASARGAGSGLDPSGWPMDGFLRGINGSKRLGQLRDSLVASDVSRRDPVMLSGLPVGANLGRMVEGKEEWVDDPRQAGLGIVYGNRFSRA